MILLLLSSIVLFSWKPPIVEGNATGMTSQEIAEQLSEQLSEKSTEFNEIDEKLTDYLDRTGLLKEKESNNIDTVIQNKNNKYIKSRENIFGEDSELNSLLNSDTFDNGAGEFVKFAALFDYQLNDIEKSISSIEQHKNVIKLFVKSKIDIN